MYLLGFDVGGTKTEAALIKYQGSGEVQVLGRRRIPTDRHLGYHTIIENFRHLALEVLQAHGMGVNDLHGIGMGIPGTVHPVAQTMSNGNSLVFLNRPIGQDLAQLLKFSGPVICENDANCFAYAEALAGAGLDYQGKTGKEIREQVAIGIILGTGCGGGIITYGKILRGQSGGAGELGHMELFSDGHPCYCGMRGCAEQYLSGPALEAAFAQRINSQIPQRPGAKEIFELYQQFDPVATAVVLQYLQHLAKFLATLTNIFAPDYFVLGGGLSLQPLIVNHFAQDIPYRKFINNYNPLVLPHRLGDSAGVIGAALLAV